MKAYLTFFLIFVSVCAKASSDEIFTEIFLDDDAIPPSLAIYYLDSNEKHGLRLKRIFENYVQYDQKKHHFILLSLVLYFKYNEQIHSKKYALYKQMILEEMNRLEAEIYRTLDITAPQLLSAYEEKETKKFLNNQRNFEKQLCILGHIFCRFR